MVWLVTAPDGSHSGSNPTSAHLQLTKHRDEVAVVVWGSTEARTAPLQEPLAWTQRTWVLPFLSPKRVTASSRVCPKKPPWRGVWMVLLLCIRWHACCCNSGFSAPGTQQRTIKQAFGARDICVPRELCMWT